ncbi:MAG: amino acid permease, partial [Acidimicrobiia bacterium]
MWVRRHRQPRPTVGDGAFSDQAPTAAAPGSTAKAPPRRYISWTVLAMMTVGSVGYLGSAPATSVFGLASVFLYVLPAFVFLIPVSLVAAELASGWQGGVYNWVQEGVSAPMGLLAVWCEFAQTIFYYPALLAYVIDPNLAANGVYNAVVIIVLFWAGVFISSRGVGLVAKLSSSGTLIGTLIPGAILVGLGIAYLAQGHHSA